MATIDPRPETAAPVAQAVADFRRGMKYREQPGIRIGWRTNRIIRFGMAGPSTRHHPVLPGVHPDNVAGMAGNMQTLNNMLANMNLPVGSLAGNVHHLSRPTKAFPL